MSDQDQSTDEILDESKFTRNPTPKGVDPDPDAPTGDAYVDQIRTVRAKRKRWSIMDFK
jgi:hypothetical protein